MKTFVTGATGLLGSNLVRALRAEGHSVRAPLAKRNLYFKSKVLAAGQLQTLAARTGLEVVQILPGWMFGPGDAAPTASGQLVLDFLAGKLPGIPPGGTSAVDARDVAMGMIRAAERGRAGEKYILG